jgi:hypothetical protein
MHCRHDWSLPNCFEVYLYGIEKLLLGIPEMGLLEPQEFHLLGYQLVHCHQVQDRILSKDIPTEAAQ